MKLTQGDCSGYFLGTTTQRQGTILCFMCFTSTSRSPRDLFFTCA